jgi:trimethylamine:corrinoid methyltransferase-like protein
MHLRTQVLSNADIRKIHATSLELMEHFIPTVSDRSMLATWQENGERDVRMRVREVIEERLDAYQKPRPPGDIEQTLEEIINSR